MGIWPSSGKLDRFRVRSVGACGVQERGKGCKFQTGKGKGGFGLLVTADPVAATNAASSTKNLFCPDDTLLALLALE